MSYERRLIDLGLKLPAEPVAPPEVRIAFEWVRVVGDRCMLSGHGALGVNGVPTGPFGKVPTAVTLADAQASARLAGLAMLSALRRSIGTLDRVRAWLVVNGFVNADEGYAQTTAVLDPVSDLLVDVFGAQGRHARTAIGVAALPLNLPVVVSAEVLVAR